MKDKFTIIFMGTPDFAVPSLHLLSQEGYDIVLVVTQPDRPAGRGQQLRPSPVKVVAEDANVFIVNEDPESVVRELGNSTPWVSKNSEGRAQRSSTSLVARKVYQLVLFAVRPVQS